MTSALCILLGLAQATSALPSASADDVAAKQRSAWESCLREVAKAEGASLFFDVSPDNRPPEGYDQPLGLKGLELLANLTIRQHRQIRGVQVFTRDLDPSKRRLFQSHVNQLAAFLSELPLDLQARVGGAGLPVSAIPDSGRWFVRFLLGDYSTIGGGRALQNWDQTVIRIKPTGAIKYTDPQTGKEETQVLSPRQPAVPVTDREVEEALRGALPLASKPLDKAPSGPLDFGQGKLAKVSQVVEDARKAFDVYYLVDARIADGYAFVSGSYDRPTFEECLREVTQAPAASALSIDPRNMKQAFDQLVSGPLSALAQADLSEYTDAGYTVADALAGKEVRVGDVVAKTGTAHLALARRGVGPDARARLAPRFRLEVLTLAERIVDGKRERYWTGGVPIAIAPER